MTTSTDTLYIPEPTADPRRYYRQGGSALDKFVAMIRMAGEIGSGQRPVIALVGQHFDEAYKAKETEMFTAQAKGGLHSSLASLCHEIERLCPQGVAAWRGMVVQFCVAADKLALEDFAPITEWLDAHPLSDNINWGIYDSAEPPMARVVVYR